MSEEGWRGGGEEGWKDERSEGQKGREYIKEEREKDGERG